MLESMLLKYIESAGQSHSYSPQQVAEMLDVNSRNIDLLDEKIRSLFWGLWCLIGIMVIFQAFSFWRFSCLEKRLKKLKEQFEEKRSAIVGSMSNEQRKIHSELLYGK